VESPVNSEEQKADDKLQSSIVRWLQGRQNKANVLLGLGATLIPFGAGFCTKEGWWLEVGLLLSGLGLLAAIFGFFLKAAEPIDESMLKGPHPFRFNEGELLPGLYRKQALSKLVDALSTGNVSAIFLIGPKGVGKTSLISGLRSSIVGKSVEPNPRFLYLDGRSQNLSSTALAGINSRLKKGQAKFASIEDVMKSEEAEQQVIVIDDAAFFESPGVLMQWVNWLSEKPGACGRKLVIVLEEALHERWMDDGQVNSELTRTVFLKRFKISTSPAAAQALASNAKMKLWGRMPSELAAGASICEADGEPRVSPLSLSVLIKCIGAERRIFTRKNYGDSGYSAGLMGSFIRRELADFSPDSAAILQAVTARHSKDGGDSAFGADDLGLGESMRSRVINALHHLSSSDMQVLSASRDRTVFAIRNEWLPAIKSLQGKPEEGRIVARSDYLDKKYACWRHQVEEAKGWFKGYRQAKYLLPRREVSLAEESWATLTLKAERGAVRGYISISRKHYRQWYLVPSVVAVIVCALLSVSLYPPLKFWRDRTIEPNHRLPRDFYKYAEQITDLTIVCMVNDLGELPRGLLSLEAGCDKIENLENVPSGLFHLGLSSTNVMDLKGVPRGVRELDFSGNSDRKLDGLEHLRPIRLNIEKISVAKLSDIPRSVVSLSLDDSNLTDLGGLPSSVTDLLLRHTGVASLKGLSDRVRSLRLIQNDRLRAIDYLPPNLVTLEAPGLPGDLAIVPPSLDNLILENAGEVKALPDVRSLELSGTTINGPLPERLESLVLNDFLPVPLVQSGLPGRLRHLKTKIKDQSELKLLPKNLLSLNLDLSLSLSSLEGLDLDHLEELNISSTGITELGGVRDSVLKLWFQSCRATELTKFPANLEELYLGVCSELSSLSKLPESLISLDVQRTNLSTLPALPRGLKVLNISNTRILGHLPKLPLELEELTLHAGQVQSLEGLPKSVKRLRFVEPSKQKAK
jgi:hypothetical protein